MLEFSLFYTVSFYTFALFCYIIHAAFCRKSQYARMLLNVPWMESEMKWRAAIREQLISGVVCVRGEMEVKWSIAGSDMTRFDPSLLQYNSWNKTSSVCVCLHLCSWDKSSLDWSLNYICISFALIIPLQLSRLVFVCFSRFREQHR